MRAMLKDPWVRCWMAGTALGSVIGVLVTQAFWGVGLFR
jgi:hypothetical protein